MLPKSPTWAPLASASLIALVATATLAQADDRDARQGATRTPIKHVITIIGENRSFDHVFGLYSPRRGETVANLLSQGILNADGTPGPRFAQARQFIAAPQATYFVGGGAGNQTPYTVPPPPGRARPASVRRPSQ